MNARAAVDHALTATDDWGCIEARLPDARGDAERSEARRIAGTQIGPLDGMTFAVKANLDVVGLPTTAGTTVPREPATSDSAVVAQLRAAGAIPVLTTTLAEAAIGSVTANPWTGICVSPTDPTRNAGGSSGGSAAAVAASLVSFALGTDTMGSVRIPAACCGIVGWKPTLGAISTEGLVPLSSALDTVGVLAPNPAALLAVARVLLAEAPMPPVQRVGIASLTAVADAPARAAVEHAAAKLRRDGIEVVEIALDVDTGRVRRRGLLLCEAEAADYWGTAVDGKPAGLSEPLRALLRFGREASTEALEAAETARTNVEQVVRAVFDEVDVLLLPTLPGPIPAGHEDPTDLADLTAFVNLAGVPAVSVPTTVTAPGEKIPRSIQLVGPHGHDVVLIELAATLDV